MKRSIEEKIKDYYETNNRNSINKMKYNYDEKNIDKPKTTSPAKHSYKSNSKKKSIFSCLFKTILFWMIVLLYLELSFRMSMNYKFNKESFINIFLFALILGNLFSLVFQSLNKKLSTIFTAIWLAILGVVFSVQCVFFQIFKTYFSLSSLELGDQVGGFLDQAISKIVHNAGYILLFFIPFILFLILKRFIKLEKNKIPNFIMYFTSLCISLILLTSHIVSTKGKPSSSYKLYYEVNIVSLNNERFGVIHSYVIDFYRYVTGFEEELTKETSLLAYNEDNSGEEEEEPIVYEYNETELDFEKSTSNKEIQKINDYLKNDTPTLQNKYTGMFEGYNLVYITAESFYTTGIDEEVTPTLYKMANSGFVFKNFYTPLALSTIGGEFQSLTGLYPNLDTLPIWRKGTNYFPYGLATVFADKGYNTYAYHDHHYAFQDRNKYIKTQGFDNYLAVNNGLEKRINSRLWPESDVEMMESTVTDYLDDSNPFLAYYMTVSGHMDYNFDGGNAMSSKNKDAVKDLDLPERDKAYIATQVELDRALEALIEELDKEGKLEKTVFVMLADHYPYALSIDDINSMSTYERDEIVEVNHNTLIIWNSEMEPVEINKVCMSVDVLPTVLNLFGIEYDSRLFTGKDILSNTGGLAIFTDRSWVSDKGTYFAASGKFVPKEVDKEEDTEDQLKESNTETTEEFNEDEYIENVNNIVQNRMNIAKWIIQYNYYNYLMK